MVHTRTLALLVASALGNAVAIGCGGEPPLPPPAPTPTVHEATPPPPAPRADGRLPALAKPTRYALDLHVDPSAATFSGVAKIDVEIPAKTSFVVLHGRSLQISDARALVAGRAITARPSFRLSAGGKAPEELVLAFAEPLPQGAASLVVTYTAPFDDELSGLYRARDGERSFAFTQFEATDARRAFPCFDDPSFKVPFELTVSVPKGLSAFSNAPEASREEVGRETRFRFSPTKPLPTYLVALAVGEFDVVEATRYTRPPVRLIAPKGKGGLGALALEATSGILDELARWFDVPYGYDKLDIVAVPDFRPGGMENAGLVTFREERLLLDPARASLAARRTQAILIAHELAHQWFGDLVTASWWNDLWLNEGMATWMEWKVVQRWRPSLGGNLDAVASSLAVMDLDGLATARAVRQPVSSTSEAQEAFDGITYGKGAAVLSTIERWVGEAAFQRGIRDYLRENAHTSVEASRLFSALDRASGKDVTQMASAYLDKPGVPEVSMHLECERGSRWHIELTQEPWRPLGSTKPEVSDQVWTIPVCVRAPGDKKSTCADLAMGAPSLVAGRGQCPAFIHPNAESSYYRFSLDDKELVRLVSTQDKQDAAGRVSALSNAWAMTRAGKVKPDVLLKVLPAFDDDKPRQVIDQLIAILNGMNEALLDEDARPAFKKFVAARLTKRKQRLGWSARGGEGAKEDTNDDTLVRPSVLAAMANLAEDEATLREANELTLKWLANPASVDPDIAGVAVELGSRRAGPERLAALRDAAKKVKSRDDRIFALRAMSGFEDKALVEAGLSVALTDEVKPSELRYVFASAYSRPRTRTIFEAWQRAHWAELRKKLPGSLSAGLVGGAATGCSREAANDNASFYKSRMADIEGAARGLEHSLETVALCAALREQSGPAFRRALLNRK